eukprot:scaffold8556_cov286-Pinguiococcus_pyrenoidosus.AAC.10
MEVAPFGLFLLVLEIEAWERPLGGPNPLALFSSCLCISPSLHIAVITARSAPARQSCSEARLAHPDRAHRVCIKVRNRTFPALVGLFIRIWVAVDDEWPQVERSTSANEPARRLPCTRKKFKSS